MDEMNEDKIVFELEDGTVMEFSVMHEFCHEGGMYAVLRNAVNADETLIAQIMDPLGPDEEFVPLPMGRQQELLEYLNKSETGED